MADSFTAAEHSGLSDGVGSDNWWKRFDPESQIPALLALPQPQVRELVRRYQYQFRVDKCRIQHLTGAEVRRLPAGRSKEEVHFSKGRLAFRSQIIQPGDFDDHRRVVFYVIGTPIEASSRLGVNIQLPEKFKEEMVIFVFHVQYAI